MSQSMTPPKPTEQETGLAPDVRVTLHHVRFLEHASDDQVVLLEFAHPAPRKAVYVVTPLDEPPAPPETPDTDELLVLVVPRQLKDDPRWRDQIHEWGTQSSDRRAAPPITVKIKNTEILWRAGRAVIFATPEWVEPMLEAVVDFAFFEGELRKLEQEIADFWPEVERDTPLAYEVKKNDPERFESIRRRMDSVLARRMRHARMESNLYWPPAYLPEPAHELGELLREEASVEDRVEVVDGQLEVQESVFELSSQRISDYRLARHGFILEMIIVVVLVAESLLILGEILWCLE